MGYKNKDFIVRPFQPCDQAAAKQLVLEGLSERFQPFRPELNTDVNDIGSNFDIFLVGYVGPTLVATGGLRLLSKDTAKVVRMSTAKAFRGQGFASKIFAELTIVAKARGIKHLTLVTGQSWTDAIRFYKRHGFTIQGVSR
jgi:GNAT superfamily N-acetyltransferase